MFNDNLRAGFLPDVIGFATVDISMNSSLNIFSSILYALEMGESLLAIRYRMKQVLNLRQEPGS